MPQARIVSSNDVEIPYMGMSLEGSNLPNENAPIDMNNPANLGLYSHLLLFKNDGSRQDIIYQDLESSLQRTLGY